MSTIFGASFGFRLSRAPSVVFNGHGAPRMLLFNKKERIGVVKSCPRNDAIRAIFPLRLVVHVGIDTSPPQHWLMGT